jgi:hypothetical protein
MITALACWIGLLLADPMSEAQLDAGARAKLLAPLLSEQTFAVVHIDVARYDVEGIVKSVVPLIPENLRSEVEESLQSVKKLQTAFTKAGGRELIILFDVEELLVSPSYVYVPLTDKADATALTRWLQESLPFGREVKVQKAGNLLVAGPAAALKRLAGRREPVAREGLAEAVKAAGEPAVGILLLPTRDQRRVIEEVVPYLPQGVGGIPSKQLTRGVRWAALGIDVAPKPSFKLTIQCADATAAKTVTALIAAGVQALGNARFVGEDKPFRELFPAEYGLIAKALQPEAKEDQLVVAVSDPATILATIAKSEDLLARFLQTRDNEKLHLLALGMHNYHSAYNAFPAHAIYSKDGKPLLSWRVALLPYLEQDNLYKQFKLDEPWDSEHNKKLIEKMPDVFRSSRMKVKKAGMTTFLAPVGEGLMFTGTAQGSKIADITDGTSNTIMLVDAADEQAVVWTKPDDLKVDPNAPFKGLLGHYPGFFLAAFADGSQHAIPKNLPPKTLWALFTRSGGEVIDWPRE